MKQKKYGKLLCMTMAAIVCLAAGCGRQDMETVKTEDQGLSAPESGPDGQETTASEEKDTGKTEAAAVCDTDVAPWEANGAPWEVNGAPWEAMKDYAAGDIVSYGGAYYECRQSHQSLEGWEPELTPALWAVYAQKLPGAEAAQGNQTVQEPKPIRAQTQQQEKQEPEKTALPLPASSLLPERILTGYWQNFDNGATCLRLSDVPEEYNMICIAFAEAAQTAGAIGFRLDSQLTAALGGYTEEDFKADVDAAHKKGQKVLLSVGGEAGNVIVDSVSAADAFADSAYALMQEYGFDGIDIDLEHGIDVKYLSEALHTLADKAGDGFLLTMAPQTIDIYTYDAAYLQLGRECGDILTIMNTQYYNSGTMPGYDGTVYSQGTTGFLSALAVTQLEGGLRPDQIGIGLPATPQAAGGGWQPPENVAAAIESLVYGKEADGFKPPQAYHNIRGAMTWSINWDAANQYEFAETMSACFKKLPPVIAEE